MPISNYSYEIKGSKIIITDLCTMLGGMSVTNNIDNILRDIGIREQIDYKSYIVHYYDSTDELTGFDPINGTFYPIRII